MSIAVHLSPVLFLLFSLDFGFLIFAGFWRTMPLLSAQNRIVTPIWLKIGYTNTRNERICLVFLRSDVPLLESFLDIYVNCFGSVSRYLILPPL